MQKRGGGYHDFSFKIFCLTTEKFRRGTLRCVRKFRVSKNFMHQKKREGGITFLRRKLFVILVGTLRCFRKFRLSQNFMHKKGISLKFVEESLSHSADKIRRRTLVCFERILVSKIFKQRRWKLHGFVEIFLSHRTEKTSPGNHSVFQKISAREKYFMDKRGSITIFSRNFCLTVPKNFVRVSYCL